MRISSEDSHPRELGYAFGEIGHNLENEVGILIGTGDTFIDWKDFGVDEITPEDWQQG